MNQNEDEQGAPQRKQGAPKNEENKQLSQISQDLPLFGTQNEEPQCETQRVTGAP